MPDLNPQRGAIAMFLLLAVIVLGAVLLSRGILPKFSYSENRGPSFGTVASVTPFPEHNSLQLGTIKFCSETIAVNFLLDSSGSMGRGNKMDELKTGLRTFLRQYPQDGPIAMQKFSGPSSLPNGGVVEMVPFSLYRDVEEQVEREISQMRPLGATYSRTAFEFVRPILQNAQRSYPQKINLIFISDGVPEVEGKSLSDPRFSPEQDPSEVAGEIKRMGIEIYTIAYLDQRDQQERRQLEQLMRNVASDPDSDHFFVAPTTNKLDQIVKDLLVELCQN